ncbi:hypothetical protein EDD21DRAFT_392848 [Dissophora ornata]|nr:hypothetical protein EDD21DRAFT_392848 [Dissophora ornata]
MWILNVLSLGLSALSLLTPHSNAVRGGNGGKKIRALDSSPPPPFSDLSLSFSLSGIFKIARRIPYPLSLYQDTQIPLDAT